MSDAKRILTVSYGTFSCTLEGFADPMATLREVTDHFRALAAQDRSFGAAPVAKDAGVSPAMTGDEDWRGESIFTKPAPPRALTKAGEVSVSRLISATDSALNDPETQRRRAATAQLKAVVLAQMAERRGPSDKTASAGKRRSAFQHDLDQTLPPAPLSAQQARRGGPERA